MAGTTATRATTPYEQGKKTVSFEICEQLGWQAPDQILCAMAHRGVQGLRICWLGPHARLMGIQAEGQRLPYQAWRSGEDVLTKPPITAQTNRRQHQRWSARDRIKALAAVTGTNGLI